MRLPDLVNPDKVALLTFAKVITPPPPVDLNAWAVENVVFGSDSPYPGSYDPKLFPWNGPILIALGPDDPCFIVVYMKSIQVGGTALAQIFIGGKQDLDPGPAMFTHPTESNGRRFVRTKLRPFLRNSKSLKRLFPEKTRDAGASLDFQERIDGRGSILHGAATSASDLSQVSIRDQVEDDLDKWQSDGTTGDPEKNADGRCEAYMRAGVAKIFKIGNPVNLHDSRITRAYETGTQEKWGIPCPRCGQLQALEWDNLREVIEGERDRLRDGGMAEEDAREAAARAAHFTCIGCGEAISQADYAAGKLSGTMLVGNPRARLRVRSFYVWSAYVKNWSEIARKWFAAKGLPEAEQTFLNEECGLAYETAGEAPPWKDIRDRAERIGHDRGTIPEGGLILVITVDCQGDRVEWHAKAFGAGLRRWTVDYGVIRGHIGDEAARAQLDALLERRWPNAFGHHRRGELLLIDAGAYKADVEGWVARHPPSRVWMVRGSKDQYASDLAIVRTKKQRREARATTGRSGHTIHWVGAAVIKAQLYRCLTKSDPLDIGFCGYPKGLDDEFYRQLTSEKRLKRKGTEDWYWEKVHSDNEVLDTEVYAQAGAVAMGWKANDDGRWEDLRKRWETPGDPSGQRDLFTTAPRDDQSPGAATPVALPDDDSDDTGGHDRAANAVRSASFADAWASINSDD